MANRNTIQTRFEGAHRATEKLVMIIILLISRHCLVCWVSTREFSQTVLMRVSTWWSRTTPSAGTSSSPSSSPPPSSPPLGMVTLLLSQYQVGCFYFIPSPLNTDWLQVAGSAWSMPLLVSPCVCPYWQTLVRFWQQLSARWLSSTRCLLYQYLRNITWLLKRKSMSQDYLAFFFEISSVEKLHAFHETDWSWIWLISWIYPWF